MTGRKDPLHKTEVAPPQDDPRTRLQELSDAPSDLLHPTDAHEIFSAFIRADTVAALSNELKNTSDVLAFPEKASRFLWELALYFARLHPDIAWYLVYYPHMILGGITRIVSSDSEIDASKWNLPGNTSHQSAVRAAWIQHKDAVSRSRFRLHKHFEQVNVVAALKGSRAFVLALDQRGGSVVYDLQGSDQPEPFLKWMHLDDNGTSDRDAYDAYMKAFLPTVGTQTALLVTNPFDGKINGIAYGYGSLDDMRRAGATICELLSDAMHFLREQEARINTLAAVAAEFGAAAAHELRNQGFVVETVAAKARRQLQSNAPAEAVELTLEQLSGIAAYLRWPWTDNEQGRQLAPAADAFLQKAARSLWLQHRGLDARPNVSVEPIDHSRGVVDRLSAKCMRACVEILRNAIRHAGESPRLRLRVLVGAGEVVITSSGGPDEAELLEVKKRWTGEYESSASSGIGLARRSLREARWSCVPEVKGDVLTLRLTTQPEVLR